MAETSYPSPNHNSRNVTDGEYERIGAYVGDGVHGSPSDGDVVVPGVGLQVLIKAGTVASVRGHVWEAGTTDVALTVSANAASETRYDWVTLRLDRSTWDVSAHVVEGTAGAGYPAYANDIGDTGSFDISLARLSVAPGAAAPTITRVTRYSQTSVSVANSTESPFGNKAGDLLFRPDSGSLDLWDGSSSQTVFYDSGDLALGPGFSTWVPDSDNIGRRKADVIRLRIAVRRVSNEFSRNDPTGSKIGTVPAVFSPSRYEYFAGTFTNGATGRIEVRTDGTIWVTHASSDVPAGETLAASVTYLV